MLKELEANTEHQKQTRQVSAEFQEVSTNLRLHDQSAVQYLACDCFMLVQCCPSFVLLPDTCHSRQMNISLRRQPKFSKSVYLTNLMHWFFFELKTQKNWSNRRIMEFVVDCKQFIWKQEELATLSKLILKIQDSIILRDFLHHYFGKFF